MACSSSHLPPAKRLSGDSENEAPNPAVLRSPDLWLSDGTIVLRTTNQDTNSQTLFRVHKSTLALHSSFFRDPFDGPQAVLDAASERYEGLPVMDMMDDPRDVDGFLRAMYLPWYTQRHLGPTLEGLDKSNFPGMYEGILRLCKKYDAQDLRRLIVDAIRKEWPTTLDRWYAKREELLKNYYIVRNHSLQREIGILPHCVYPNPAQTIRIATDFDIPDVLPLAFYVLATTYTFNEGDEDGNTHDGTDLDALSARELRKLIIGTATLRKTVKSAEILSYSLRKDDCCRAKDGSRHSPCMKILRTWWREVEPFMYRTSDHLKWLRRVDNLAYEPEQVALRDLCYLCMERIKEVFRERATEVWEKLLSIFGLYDIAGKNWGTLHAT